MPASVMPTPGLAAAAAFGVAVAGGQRLLVSVLLADSPVAASELHELVRTGNLLEVLPDNIDAQDWPYQHFGDDC